MTTEPTPVSQPDWFDFHISSHSPPQSSTATFTPESRRHTAYARTESERPVISPILPFTPPSSQAPSVSLDIGEVQEEPWFPAGEDNTINAEADDEEDPSRGIENPGLVVASRLQAPIDLYGTQVRSFHSLADENILTNYSPSPTDTPLNDPQTAAVFWYFVNVTAPALSLFERNPVDPSRMFSGDIIPKSQQHIWTCEFPRAKRSFEIVQLSPHRCLPRLFFPSSGPSSSNSRLGKPTDGRIEGRCTNCFMATLRTLHPSKLQELPELE